MISFGFCQQPIANRQKRFLPFALRLLLLTSHVSLLTLFLVLPAFSQQRWERTYGGAGDDYGKSVQQTSDRGYIIAGATNSFGAGSEDFYLIKTNAFGDTLWTRTYGGMLDDWGTSVQQTSDGGYIISGNADSFGAGLYDIYLIKTNPSGDTLWTRTYGGAGDDYGYSVQQTQDGGYIIAGTTNSFGAGYGDVYLIKTNAIGDTLWTKTYGGTGNDGGYSVQQTSDRGYIIVGYTHSFGAGGYDVWLIKTNASGDTLWTRTYGGTNMDEGWSVRQTSDGGYIVAGGTCSFGDTLGNVYLIKTNSLGDTLWTRTYGGTNQTWGYSVWQTSDSGYIIVGYGHVYLIKTNATGDTLWTRKYGGTGEDWGYSVQQTSDGGYIVAGYTNSFGAGRNDVYLIKTDANGNSGVEVSPLHPSRLMANVFRPVPNPFTTFAMIPGHSSDRFALYDISGRKVGTYRGDRIGEGLAVGVYFLKPEIKDANSLRIIKLK